MKHFLTAKGNLCLQAEPDDFEMLEALFQRAGHDDDRFLAELLEETGWLPNGVLYQVAPETVAALTSAPILSDDVVVEDDGTTSVLGKVWWYPDYAVRSMPEQLTRKGQVVFTLAE